MQQGTTASALAGIPLFSELDARALARLARGTAELEVARGVVLYARGQPAERIYAVLSGRVKLSLRTLHDDEKVVALVGRGETFGEAAALMGEPHVLCAQALVATSLLAIDNTAVLACMGRDAAFATRMAVWLSRRLRRLMREIENSALHSGTDRVVDFLVRELDHASGDGAAIVELPAKKRVIASRLDLTHEHFSRILRDLAAASLLVVDGPRVSIPDIARLRAFHGEAYPESAQAAVPSAARN